MLHSGRETGEEPRAIVVRPVSLYVQQGKILRCTRPSLELIVIATRREGALVLPIGSALF